MSDLDLMTVVQIGCDEEYDAAVRRICAPERGAAAGALRAEQLDATRVIVENVRQRGDAALAEYTERFDHVSLRPDEFEVSPQEIDAAAVQVDRELLNALERAHANITAFHKKNLRTSWEETSPDGSVLGQRITPLASVGLYAPGGKAFYPSTMLMNLVPARVAGVQEIIVVSPPSYNRTIHPLALAAAKLGGATRVFRVGGAQAIAALAYGTDTIPAVEKIAGPGNVFVTLAKRLVSTVCDIDKEAGPSEVVVLADGSADARLAAAELLAQAEHDEQAKPIMVTTSVEFADAVRAAVAAELRTLPRADLLRAALRGQGRIYVVRDIDEAARLTNVIAPEHLAIQTSDPRAAFEKIHNAGCAVLGAGTSVAVGDYYAGPNHVLPTDRKARFASPLTADDFRKITSVISYSPGRMRSAADDIIRLANAEQLQAHARAMEIRR